MNETKKIFRASGKIGILTLISRILGFGRDIMMAALFGTSMASDAFFLAFKIPNLFRRLLGEGTLNAAFIPVYSEKLKDNPEEAHYLVSNTLTILAVVLGLIVATGVLCAPSMVQLFAFGWQDNVAKVALTAQLLRILFPYLVFISLALLLGAVLNTHRVFSVPALSPAVLNFCWITGLATVMLMGSGDTETHILIVAVAVVIGGAGQLLVHIPAFIKLKVGFRPIFNVRGTAFREVITLVLPGIFGMAVTQVNLIIDSVLATFLVGGSITALMLSNRLVMLPLGVFGVAVATALLPALSARAAEKDYAGMLSAFSDALDAIFFVMIPISMFLIILAAPTVRLVYEHGNFDAASSTPLTTFALIFYAMGLFAYAGHKIIVQAFYSLKDTKTPVKVATFNMLLNIVFNIIFIIIFEQVKPGFGLGGLALGTALSSVVNIFILLFLFKKRLPEFSTGERLRRLLLFAGCGSIASGGAYIVYQFVSTLVLGMEFWAVLIPYIAALIGMVSVYVLLSYLLKIKELHLLLGAVKRRS